MIALLPLFLLGLLLIAAGLVRTLVELRDARRELHRRTDLVAHVPHAHTQAGVKGMLMPQVTRMANWFLDVFTFGLPHRWGMHTGPVALLLAGLAGGAASWFLLHTLFRLPFWITVPVTLAAFVALPRQVLKMQQRSAELVFLDLFPDALDMVVRMVRAGLPVMAAVRAVGNEAPPPVGAVFSSLADQVDIGILFEDALAQAGERIGLPDFRFFAVAVSLQHGTGGNIAATLETLAEIIRKRRVARMQARSTTGEVRMSAIVLAVLPFVVIGGLLAVRPSYLAPLITDPRGNVIVGLAIVLLVLGFATMRRMMHRATQL